MISRPTRVALPFGRGTPESKRAPYRGALKAAGIELDEDASTVDGLDGLLLAGGTDIDPALYGAPRDPRTGAPDRDRDTLECTLLTQALNRGLPVLAICRGMQFLNAFLGGTLVQNIEGHLCPDVRTAHRITIASPSRLASILGADEYVVNSRHHQCVDRVASELTVVARAPDDVPEALELPGHRFALAVQWHPEDRTDGPDFKLFETFRDAMKHAAEK
jgi:gamma-glutamyl-gamma-aminobutyrate hydrolase PuuD